MRLSDLHLFGNFIIIQMNDFDELITLKDDKKPENDRYVAPENVRRCR